MKIILCSLGVMSCILLLGAYFINRRRAPRIFLEERMAMQLEEQLEEKEKSWIEKLKIWNTVRQESRSISIS